jgi:hypothetical protein
VKKLKSQQIARHYFCFERAICGAVRRKEKPNDIILANKNYFSTILVLLLLVVLPELGLLP